MPRFSTPLWVIVLLGFLAAGSATPARAAAQDSGNAFEEAGLTSPTTYESPNFGYAVAWTDDWGVDETRVDPVFNINLLAIDRSQDTAVYTDVESGRDRLDLWNSDGTARVRIVAAPASQGVQYQAEYLVSNYIDEMLGGSVETLLGVEVNDSLFGVLHRHHQNDGSTLLSYNEVSALGEQDAWLWVQVTAPADEFEAAYLAALASVTIDGSGLEGIFTTQDIQDAAGETEFVLPADHGVTSATTWTSPLYGFDVEWASDWTSYGNFGSQTGNGSNQETGQDSLRVRPKFSDPDFTMITVRGQPNADNASLDDLVRAESEAAIADEREVLVSAVEEGVGVVMTRKVYDDGSGSITYTELALSDDATGIIDASFVIDPGVFADRFDLALGAVSIDGRAFASVYDPAELAAVAEGEATVSMLSPDHLLAIKKRDAQAETIVDAYGDAGMTWTNAYESPAYGYGVEWTSDWQLNMIDGDAPVVSDDEGDTLMIWNKYAGIRLEITTMPMENPAVAGLVEFLEDTCADSQETSCEVLMTTVETEAGAVIVTEFNDETNTDWATYYGFTIADDGETVLWVSMSVSATSLDYAFELAPATIEIGGEPIALMFDRDDLPVDE